MSLLASGSAPAMVLAAGRGARMRPLTDVTPKPLLHVQGQALLHWHLDALAAAGHPEAVINTAWLGEQIPAVCGERWRGGDLRLRYSMEGRDFGTALETAGGIVRALPALAPVFWVVAGDVYVPGFAFSLAEMARFTATDRLAHVWLVPNPEHHPTGDFGCSATGLAQDWPAKDPRPRQTYSTIALFRQEFFAESRCGIPWGNPQGQAAPLGPLLRAAMAHGSVGAQTWSGAWTDVGTPQRLAQLQSPVRV